MKVSLAALVLLLSSLTDCEPLADPDPATIVVFNLGEGEDGLIDDKRLVDGSYHGDKNIDVQDQNLLDSNIEVATTISVEGNGKEIVSTIIDAINNKGAKSHSEDLNSKEIGSNIFNAINGIEKEPGKHHNIPRQLGIPNILDHVRAQKPDEKGRVCMDKTMMRRETQYEEVMRCDHSYDQRCHTSYTTNYVPHLEEECEEKFRKVCMISYEQKAVTEEVEECTTPLVPDCDNTGPKKCRTVYDTVCDTRKVQYEVEEDFPTCRTVNMEKCEEVNKCEVWPVQQCSVETRTVSHSKPETQCRKEPRDICVPSGCPMVEVHITYKTVLWWRYL